MQLNLKTRMKQKYFWTGIIGLIPIIINNFAMLLGHDWSQQSNMVIAIATAILGIFVLLGIVVDPNTEGLGDSTRAMTYDKPKEEFEENVFIPKDFNKTYVKDIENDTELPDYSTGGGSPNELKQDDLDLTDEKAILEGDVING